ncbi:hypothetical protein KMZ68_17155 [Bradyrhizobium sediminis]|uniref:Uncharacterized protein n=1 Tax=Bradyrhizobium sediminis TaxID=2840469 RepID=A0A975NTF3_9BRAD|nr:hypothetical protein [Bradyrhizobium sediminis]QWG21038.1 hypothetical protein KMZ68_17155 [Bradyrhizobium sediminis]
MLTALTTPALTLLFLGVVVALGAAFVWMFWEIEQVKARHDRFAAAARRPRHSRSG